MIGADVRDRGADFFDLGGGSLTAAQIVSRLRRKFPEATVADLYEHPTVAALAAALDGMATPVARTNRRVRPTPTKTQVGQLAFTAPAAHHHGAALADLGGHRQQRRLRRARPDVPAHRPVGWPFSSAGAAGLAPSAGWGSARPAPACCSPGSARATYPRGGRVHLRLWLAERLADECGAANLVGRAVVPALRTRARRAGGQRRRPALGTACHRPLTLGDGCSVEPEVDLTGHWLDGDVLHIGDGQGRGRRAGRHPQHPRPGRRRGSRSRGRTRVLRARSGPPPRVLVRLAGRAGGTRRAVRGPPTARPGRSAGPSATRDGARPLAAAGGRRAGRDARGPSRGARRRPASGTPSSTPCPGSRLRWWSRSPRWGCWSCSSYASEEPGCDPVTTRCTAGPPGRRGRPCACSTRPGPGSTRSTRAP